MTSLLQSNLHTDKWCYFEVCLSHHRVVIVKSLKVHLHRRGYVNLSIIRTLFDQSPFTNNEVKYIFKSKIYLRLLLYNNNLYKCNYVFYTRVQLRFVKIIITNI